MKRRALVLLGPLVAMLFGSDAYGQLRVRKNYMCLTGPERQDFVDAVKALKANTADHGSITDGVGTCSWENTYDKYVCWHQRCGCTNGNQHGRPMFAPWHRELLRRFELDLRTTGGKPNLTIPYWDWTQTFPRDKEAPGDKNFMGDAPEPPDMVPGPVTNGPFAGTAQWLTQEMRALERARAEAVVGISNATLAGILSASFYDADPWNGTMNSADGLRFKLEAAHNIAHGDVGGQMGITAQSPDDPVFWLHHCFVDFLWDSWERTHPGIDHYLPLLPNMEENIGIDTVMPPSPPWANTPRDVLCVEALGYTYRAVFSLSFSTDDEGQPLVHGQHLDNGGPEFDGGTVFPVTLTSSVNTSGLPTAAILNSDTGPAALDPDLLVHTGNILILQTDANTR